MSYIEMVIYELLLSLVGILIIITTNFSGNIRPLIIEIVLLAVMAVIPVCRNVIEDEDDSYNNEKFLDDDAINAKISFFIFIFLIFSIIYTILMFIFIKTGVVNLPIMVAFLPALVVSMFFILSVFVTIIMRVADGMRKK